ncbi:caspase family protein [Paractinoplanes toevensis]|uniref:Peptidase C14 caspase domain-containing protein n=1 Tax=Paractinoplanes toevensis TaxID=571911 RepID=A0A919T7H1_9ACTN|nr:caspase family protein [Actinoplanes toevensis]GIM89144.1 hypothetical protein Ato02nite_009370 [Actinoplanes toevensis]
MSSAPDRHALVIATSVYDDRSLARLRAPANDALDMAAVLSDPESGGFAVTTVADARESVIRREVDQFLHGRRTGDVVGQLEGSGRVVMTASGATEYSWEGEPLDGAANQRSVFTGALVKGLRGDADRQGRGFITVDDAYDYASDEMKRLGAKQRPEIATVRGRGEIVLTRTARRPASSRAVPAAVIAGLSSADEETRFDAYVALSPWLGSQDPAEQQTGPAPAACGRRSARAGETVTGEQRRSARRGPGLPAPAGPPGC